MNRHLKLNVESLSKRFSGRFVLKQISFSLASSEILLLTGHNGAGKSTLMRLIAGLMQPSLGHVRLYERAQKLDMTHVQLDIAQEVGFISHTTGLYGDLTARENLYFFDKLHRTQMRSQKTPQLAHAVSLEKGLSVGQALDMVALASHQHRLVREFSAGMKKRLALAKILIKNPGLILLDEPFGELDPAGILLMEQLIQTWGQQHKILIVSTHFIEQGVRLSTQRLHLEQGCVQTNYREPI